MKAGWIWELHLCRNKICERKRWKKKTQVKPNQETHPCLHTNTRDKALSSPMASLCHEVQTIVHEHVRHEQGGAEDQWRDEGRTSRVIKTDRSRTRLKILWFSLCTFHFRLLLKAKKNGKQRNVLRQSCLRTESLHGGFHQFVEKSPNINKTDRKWQMKNIPRLF